jgi:hypothetical protein
MAPLSCPGATNVVIHKRRKIYENWVEPNMIFFAKGNFFMKTGCQILTSLHLLLKILPLVIAAAVKPHKLRVELVLPPAVG